MTFIEACSTAASIGIGGASPTGTMSISTTELSKITAEYASTKFLTFESLHGAITVNSVHQGNDIPNANLVQVKIIALSVKTITFTEDASYFSSLIVESDGGITLDEKLATTFGSMSLTYRGGNLAVATDTELYSAGLMTLTAGSTSYSLTGADPLPIHAYNDLTINSKVLITGSSGALELHSNGTVTLSESVTSSGEISIIGDADCTGSSGVVIFDSLTSSDISIQGGSFALSGSIVLGEGDLTLIEACTSTASIGVGGSNPSEAMSISTAELGLISASYNSGKYITLKSLKGAVVIYGVQQGTLLCNFFENISNVDEVMICRMDNSHK